MGVFGQNARRNREISAYDDFSFHVPENDRAKPGRLELDCFKKKAEYRRSDMNAVYRSQKGNSSGSLKSDGEMSDFEEFTKPETNFCIAFNDLEINELLPTAKEKYSSPYSNRYDAYDDRFSDLGSQEKCRKMLNSHATKCTTAKVLLYPEEEWAKNATSVQWTIKLNKWWKKYCTVTESSLGGSRTLSAVGKITQNGDGTLTISGRFKRSDSPDFKLHLSTRLTQKDIQNGYLLTGALQQGDMKKNSSMEITHFAVVPRHQ